MAKFFDTISIPILINKALDLGFPLLDMVLTLHQHLAPRIIQCEGFCGMPILITKSILAGCKHSVALTRLLLLDGLSDLTIDHPLALPKVYGDDTAQLSAGSAKETMKSMFLAVLDFVELVKSLELVLSTKGVIVAKKEKDARLFAAELAKRGII